MMPVPRKKILQLKEDLRIQIERDAARYKRAIIREIEFIASRTKDGNIVNLEELFDKVMKRLKVPAATQRVIENDLEEIQAQIADVWDDYFENDIKAGKQISLTNADYEKMLAAYKVDFSGVKETMRDRVESEFRKSIKSDYSFSKFRSILKQKDIGDFEATTLANTSVAQFDNAYMLENAQQIGVEKFIWDGPAPMFNSHLICKKNAGKIFTINQLEAMDNGTDLPVITSLGGYNCRHFLTPVIK